MDHDASFEESSCPPHVCTPEGHSFDGAATPVELAQTARPISDVGSRAVTHVRPEDGSDGGGVAETRVITDPWSEPPGRRAIGFLAAQKADRPLSEIRIDPLPIDGGGRTLRWLCFSTQDELDDWRTSDDHAFAALTAVERWLSGDCLGLGGALGIYFPLMPVWEALLGCLDTRARDVLRRRAAGETLESISAIHTITGERVRQIESGAVDRLSRRILVLRSVHHPAALSLLGHARRLANKVLNTASRKDSVLFAETKLFWIKRALEVSETGILLILLRLSEDAAPEHRPLFDPLSIAGWPFQNGRTALGWRDEHVDALRTAFRSVVGDRKRRWAEIEVVCAASRLGQETARAIARFVDLSIYGGWIFEGPLKESDVQRAMIADTLSSAGRAMHYAEVLESVIPFASAIDSTFWDVDRIMSDDPDTFARDGRGMWRLRRELESDTGDQRPEHPDLPPPLTQSELEDTLAILSRSEQCRREPVLEGLDSQAAEFAVRAGDRLATRLSGLPEAERVSLGQVLTADDQRKLTDWLNTAQLPQNPDGPHEHGQSPWILQGLTMLAAFVGVIRSSCGSDDAYWAAIWSACGEGVRTSIFNTQQAPRRWMLEMLVQVTTAFRLRRAFSFQSDPWASLLALQAGLLPNDLGMLARWLSTSIPTVAIRQLVAPGPNHSASMACTWNSLQAYRRGNVGRDVISMLAEKSEWWPGWQTDEVCRSCTESLPQYERSFPALLQPKPVSQQEDLLVPTPTDKPIVAHPPLVSLPHDSGSLLGTLEVSLGANGEAFVVELPSQLRMSPGHVAICGDGFRLGGVVHEDGSVSWHADQVRIRLGLRGSPERTFRVERGSTLLGSQSVRLWAPDDYVIAYPIGAKGGRAFDPFVTPLPRTGGLALLLYHTLLVSVDADEEHRLDDLYSLKVFQSGLPNGTTISCEGEVLWQAEYPSESRGVARDLVAYLHLDGTAARWGACTDLVLPSPPPGFIPSRARFGAHALPAERDGSAWRFPGFPLLPGMDTLRRRGRLDGSLNGERISVPAQVSLAHAPVGAALQADQAWQPFDAATCFEPTKHGQSRLWVCLPSVDDEQGWAIFEGPRPVLAYRQQGVALGRHVFALGEPLRVERRFFNQNGSGVPLARSTINAGVVVGCEPLSDRVRIRLSLPVGWTERHKALSWSEHGISELMHIRDVGGPNDLVFEISTAEAGGICLFHESAWLGTAMLTTDAAAAVGAFVANASIWPESLKLSISGHLPLLSVHAVHRAAAALQADRGKGIAELCRAPSTAIGAHIVGRLLQTWDPGSKLSEAIVGQFVRAVADGTNRLPCLERLAADAPISTVRILAHGLKALPNRERRPVLEAVPSRVWWK